MVYTKNLVMLFISLVLLFSCKGNTDTESQTKENSSDATACICDGSFVGKIKIDGQSELLSMYCTGEISESRGPILFRNQQFNLKGTLSSPIATGKQSITIDLTPKNNEYSYQGLNCELNIASLTDLAPSNSCNRENMQIAKGSVACKAGILTGSSEVRDLDIVDNFKISFNILNSHN